MGNLLGTVPTDDFGNYSFFALSGFDYELYAATCKPRGGTNVADVNLVVAHLLGNALTGIQFLASDVNDDGVISVGDYNLLVSELLGSNPVWAAPDWVFENPSFTLTGDLTVDFQGLSSGDPDGSYAVPFGSFACEFEIFISGISWGDEITWEFRDADANVVLSGGPYGQGFSDTQTTSGCNAPYEFYMETFGTFGDNEPDYEIWRDGIMIHSGTLLGNDEITISGITCP
jgi:hypothetical protein